MLLLSLALVSFLITSIAIPFSIRIAFKYKIIDTPNKRKIHTTPIPRIGGLAIFIGITYTLSIYYLNSDAKISAILLANSIIFLTGFLDDLYDISPLKKILGQLIAISIIVFLGGIRFRLGINFLDILNSKTIAITLTFLWIIGVTNAVNLIDGLDGLMGGLSFFAFIAILTAAVSKGLEMPAAISAIIIGSVVAFLKQNLPPAKVFAGDMGSLLLGFNIGFLTLAVSNKTGTIISIIFPSLFIAIPVFDTFLAILRRIKKRVNPLTHPDKEHLHHKVLLLKFSNNQALILFYLVAGTLSIVTIKTQNKDILFGFIISLIILLSFSITLSILSKKQFEKKVKQFNKLLIKFDKKMNELAKSKTNGNEINIKILMSTSVILLLFIFFPHQNNSFTNFIIMTLLALAYIFTFISVKFYQTNLNILSFIAFWLYFYLLNTLLQSGYSVILLILAFAIIIPLLCYEIIIKGQYNILIPESTEVLLFFSVIVLSIIIKPLPITFYKNVLYATIFYLVHKTIYKNSIEITKEFFFATIIILIIIPLNFFITFKYSTTINTNNKYKHYAYSTYLTNTIKKMSHKELNNFLKKYLQQDPLIVYNSDFTKIVLNRYKEIAVSLIKNKNTKKVKSILLFLHKQSPILSKEFKKYIAKNIPTIEDSEIKKQIKAAIN